MNRIDFSRVKENSLGQGGLSTIDVGADSDVSKGCLLVGAHPSIRHEGGQIQGNRVSVYPRCNGCESKQACHFLVLARMTRKSDSLFVLGGLLYSTMLDTKARTIRYIPTTENEFSIFENESLFARSIGEKSAGPHKFPTYNGQTLKRRRS